MNIVQKVCLSVVVLASVTLGFKLTILHTNDVHGNIQEFDKYYGDCSTKESADGKCFGGVARMKTKVEELRKKYPHALLMDAGDQFQGTLLFDEFKGFLTAEAMDKILGYDIMALGNHEYDYGPVGLKPFIKNVGFPVVSTNTDHSSYSYLDPIKKSHVFTVDGQKVGVVGYTTKDTPNIAIAGNVKFFDEKTEIQKEVNNLKKQGVNKIIVLGHGGYKIDKEIAKEIKGIDVVVGGHTNTFLYSGTFPSTEKPEADYPTVVIGADNQKVLVVQNFAFGKYLGFLQVDFDAQGKVTSWTGNPILLDSSVPKDAATSKSLVKYTSKVEGYKKTIVGATTTLLDGDRKSCRAKECTMGNLITDAMLQETRAHTTYEIHAAILTGGSIRASIGKGKISVADVLNVLPYSNNNDIATISGKILRQILEKSASSWGTSKSGSFLQVSGLRVVYDMKKPEGQRVTKIEVSSVKSNNRVYEPLDPTKNYTIVSTNYIIDGGDGYSMFKGNTHSRVRGILDSLQMINYLKKHNPVTGALNNRIRM